MVALALLLALSTASVAPPSSFKVAVGIAAFVAWSANAAMSALRIAAMVALRVSVTAASVWSSYRSIPVSGLGLWKAAGDFLVQLPSVLRVQAHLFRVCAVSSARIVPVDGCTAAESIDALACWERPSAGLCRRADTRRLV